MADFPTAPEPAGTVYREAADESLQPLNVTEYPPRVGDFYKNDDGSFVAVMAVTERNVPGRINDIQINDHAWVIRLASGECAFVAFPSPPTGKEDDNA
jgi:hypothetical protein